MVVYLALRNRHPGGAHHGRKEAMGSVERHDVVHAVSPEPFEPQPESRMPSCNTASRTQLAIRLDSLRTPGIMPFRTVPANAIVGFQQIQYFRKVARVVLEVAV